MITRTFTVKLPVSDNATAEEVRHALETCILHALFIYNNAAVTRKHRETGNPIPTFAYGMPVVTHGKDFSK